MRKNSATLPVLQRLVKELKAEHRVKLHFGDMTDAHFVEKTIILANPDEIYNLAAQTHVQHSFHMPGHTFDVNFKGLLNICQALV